MSVQMHGGALEGSQLFSGLLKPESAWQEEREIYIGGYGGGKKSPTSMISLGGESIK